MSAPFAFPDLARARHARRALEQALDHGTALLAALGLPRLVGDGFVPIDREAADAALADAVALLDAIDPDPDLEPSLGTPEQRECVISYVGGRWHGVEPDQRHWTDGGSHDREQEITDEPHDDQEDEETLGWSASVSQVALGPNTADGDLTAPEHHGTGFVRCAPDDHEPNGDAEPSLGRPEGFQFETGGDLDLERVDEGGTDDGDASHITGRLQFLARASRQSEVAHA